MPPLYATVALEEVNDGTVRIGQYLNFDVTRFGHVLFDEHRSVAEGTDGFAHGAVHLLGKFLGAFYDAHPLTTTPGGGFDQDRKADLLGGALGLGHVGDGVIDSGDHRHVVVLHRILGGEFVAHHFDGVGPGSDEGDAGIGYFLGEDRILTQEPVAGMNGIGSGVAAGLDDLVHHQVGLRGGGRSE